MCASKGGPIEEMGGVSPYERSDIERSDLTSGVKRKDH